MGCCFGKYGQNFEKTPLVKRKPSKLITFYCYTTFTNVSGCLFTCDECNYSINTKGDHGKPTEIEMHNVHSYIRSHVINRHGAKSIKRTIYDSGNVYCYFI